MIQTHYKDDCSSIDLIDKTSLIPKYNKNYNFIFTKIENHTKYAWAIPRLNESGTATTQAFKILFEKEKRKPDKSRTDRGKDFLKNFF